MFRKTPNALGPSKRRMLGKHFSTVGNFLVSGRTALCSRVRPGAIWRGLGWSGAAWRGPWRDWPVVCTLWPASGEPRPPSSQAHACGGIINPPDYLPPNAADSSPLRRARTTMILYSRRDLRARGTECPGQWATHTRWQFYFHLCFLYGCIVI